MQRPGNAEHYRRFEALDRLRHARGRRRRGLFAKHQADLCAQESLSYGALAASLVPMNLAAGVPVCCQFEQVWLSRDTQLTKVPGFVEFHLLKGPEHEEYTPHTPYGRAMRRSKPWTNPEAFRLALRDAGQNKPLYLDHPQFEGFEVRAGLRIVPPVGPPTRIIAN